MAKIKITQTGSPIRRTPDQRKTLIGLGLNKMHKTVELDARYGYPTAVLLMGLTCLTLYLVFKRRGWL